MKHHFKIAALLILFLSGLMFSGCPICRCPEVQPFFDIRGIRVNHWALNDPEAGQPIDIQELRLSLSFLESYYTDFEIPSPGLSGFGNYAFACSCADPGWGGSEERFASLNVVTELPFSNTYGAGDTINRLIRIEDWNLGTMNLEDFNSAQQATIIQHNFLMTLDSAPAINDHIQFRVIADLVGGEHYEATTDSIFVR